MLKKTLIASLVATALTPVAATAADSPHSLTGNIGIYSQYIFRGVSQTNGEPALQGGLDYSHSSGFYAGTWMSNVSWLTDNNAYTGGGSLEMDFYGGFRGTFGKSDFGYDIGLLQYYYPGDPVAGGPKADTLEAYAALSWKWLSAKYSYSLNNKTFGVTNSRGTYYLDFTATVPFGNTGLTGIAHYGIQKFDGTGGCGIAGQSNDACASFDDWKIGLSYALPKDFTVGAFYTGTDMDSTQKQWYTHLGQNKFWGKDQFTVFLSKTF